MVLLIDVDRLRRVPTPELERRYEQFRSKAITHVSVMFLVGIVILVRGNIGGGTLFMFLAILFCATTVMNAKALQKELDRRKREGDPPEARWSRQGSLVLNSHSELRLEAQRFSQTSSTMSPHTANTRALHLGTTTPDGALQDGSVVENKLVHPGIVGNSTRTSGTVMQSASTTAESSNGSGTHDERDLEAGPDEEERDPDSDPQEAPKIFIEVD